jgi:single-strand DNA-binding protein
MAISVNRVIIQGNVGRDPDVRTFANGGKVANFSVGVTESWKDKASGEYKNLTEWFNVNVTNSNLVTYAEKVLKKGDRVYIEGKLRTRKYNAADGTEKTVTELLLAPYEGVLQIEKKDGARAGGDSGRGSSAKAETNANYDLDDDIPF